MNKIKRLLHLRGIWKKICLFLVNHIFTGMGKTACYIKRILLNSFGNSIGEGTTVVSPIYLKGTLITGKHCWLNCGLTVHGNGIVRIGNNCDIAPEVVFLTGGHRIGGKERRAGAGEKYEIRVGNGVWIGARSTILGSITISSGCVIVACACVNKDVPANAMVGGIPAKLIRSLSDEGVGAHKTGSKE